MAPATKISVPLMPEKKKKKKKSSRLEGEQQEEEPESSRMNDDPRLSSLLGTNSLTSVDVTSSLYDIPASDVIRLIQSFLLENGLQDTLECLQSETKCQNVKLAGLPNAAIQNLQYYASNGQWSFVLKQLYMLDRQRTKFPQDLYLDIHEMLILELAQANDLSLAYATYRFVQTELEESLYHQATIDSGDDNNTQNMTRARILEQKLAALSSVRAKDPNVAVPSDFYSTGSTSTSNDRTKKKHRHDNNQSDKGSDESSDKVKQQRRDEIGRRLVECIPQQPPQRLLTLIQQAIQWQTYTGQIPKIQQLWNDDEENDDNNEDEEDDKGDKDDNDEDNKDKKKSKKKKKHKKKRKREFDLVLGEAYVDPIAVGSTSTSLLDMPAESIPSQPYTTVKLGKRTVCESIVFLPDGSGLVTGSSDGLIEIWGSDTSYQELQLSYEYQRRDELLGHDDDVSITALAVSRTTSLLASGDHHGHVKIWNLQTGKCLRTFQAHVDNAVTCLCFSPDHQDDHGGSGSGSGDGAGGSHLLTASQDGICREFGLRTARMLKEFVGHGAYITSCTYRILVGGDGASENTKVLILTASGDGTVRVWDRSSLNCIRVLCPPLAASSASVGSSMIVLANSGGGGGSSDAAVVTTNASGGGISAAGGSGSSDPPPPITACIQLHTPNYSMIVVPRSNHAFLVTVQGTILRTFQDDSLSSKKKKAPASAHEKEDMMNNNTMSGNNAFVAATVSATNRWLYCIREDGVACVFDVVTGEMHTSIRDFGEETVRMSSKSEKLVEVSDVICHPNKSILAAYSNHKGQKRGQVQLWKS